MDDIVRQDSIVAIPEESVAEIQELSGQVEDTDNPEPRSEANENAEHDKSPCTGLAFESGPESRTEDSFVPFGENKEHVQRHSNGGKKEGNRSTLIYTTLKSWVREEEEAVDKEQDIIEYFKIAGYNPGGIDFYKSDGNNEQENSSPLFEEGGQLWNKAVLPFSVDKQEERH